VDAPESVPQEVHDTVEEDLAEARRLISRLSRAPIEGNGQGDKVPDAPMFNGSRTQWRDILPLVDVVQFSRINSVTRRWGNCRSWCLKPAATGGAAGGPLDSAAPLAVGSWPLGALLAVVVAGPPVAARLVGADGPPGVVEDRPPQGRAD